MGKRRRAAPRALAEWGERIRQLRLAKDVSQEGVAGAIGVSDGWVSDVEGGHIDPPLSKLLALLQQLDADIDVRSRVDPQVAVEGALASDPALFDHSREVILAAYRRAREDGDIAARPKKERAAASR